MEQIYLNLYENFQVIKIPANSIGRGYPSVLITNIKISICTVQYTTFFRLYRTVNHNEWEKEQLKCKTAASKNSCLKKQLPQKKSVNI